MPEVTDIFYPILKKTCFINGTTVDFVLDWLFDEIYLSAELPSSVFDYSNEEIKRWGFADIYTSDYGTKRTSNGVVLIGRLKENFKALVPGTLIVDAASTHTESDDQITLDREGLFLSFECKQLLTEPTNRVKVTGRCVDDSIWPEMSKYFDSLWDRFSKEFSAVNIDEPDSYPSNKLLDALTEKSISSTGYDIRASQRREKVKELCEKGVKVSDIASRLGVSVPTIVRDRQVLGIATPRNYKEKSPK